MRGRRSGIEEIMERREGRLGRRSSPQGMRRKRGRGEMAGWQARAAAQSEKSSLSKWLWAAVGGGAHAPARPCP
jgi:hypothetical protein